MFDRAFFIIIISIIYLYNLIQKRILIDAK